MTKPKHEVLTPQDSQAAPARSLTKEPKSRAVFANIKGALLLMAVIAESLTISRESLALDPAARYEQCREQTTRTWPKGGDTLDRARDFMMTNCINGGSPGPFYPY